MSDKKLNVYEMISQVTRLIGTRGVRKSEKNQAQGFSFRGIDQLYNTLNPILAAVGLSIIPRIISRAEGNYLSAKGSTVFKTILEVEYDLVSSHDGSKHVAKVFGESMDYGDKSTNKAYTASFKYLCWQVFCIPLSGSEDADEFSYLIEKQNTTKELNEALKKGEL